MFYSRLSFAFARIVIGLCMVCGIASADTLQVDIVGFTYSPALVQAKAGDRVSISASNVHPLRFDSNSDISCTSNCVYLLRTGLQDINFYCNNHGGAGSLGMSAVISVSDNPDFIFADDAEEILNPTNVSGIAPPT